MTKNTSRLAILATSKAALLLAGSGKGDIIDDYAFAASLGCSPFEVGCLPPPLEHPGVDARDERPRKIRSHGFEGRIEQGAMRLLELDER